MNAFLLRAAMLGIVVALASGPVLAQTNIDMGKREYESNCAGCHGLTGKGDGPFLPYLTVKTPDITLLAKKNDGVFPVSRIYEVIDGRQEVKGHGPRAMPVWGQDYLAQATGTWPMDIAYDPELVVRSRIMALVDYINRLQVK
jgi:mono/diheme cytochrome c family protein